MKTCPVWFLAFCAAHLLAGTVAAARAAGNPFAENIRPTGPLPAEQQRATFRLPPGFQIQLVAAEPDLRKPMNLAFDAVGRLWLTESREYPFPARSDAEARDTIRILSDFDATGRARRVTTFATNLNIPIGLHPFRSPDATGTNLTWKCVAWSIPNIWLFEDTDGDGVADRKEVLYGPFDYTRDTHGNQASFRRGFDGWLYATHGFNNQSRVRGRDGHEVVMRSGNTYRMRLDGSRLEHWTHGQVNPFGLCFDPRGNLYSADCHSSPIYQLLRGAYYPSFGAPDDGLGFAPTTIQHSHGSTAIAGIAYISDPSWPREFQDNILVGNVMTSRINRDQITFSGSTSRGKEMPDFLATTDPWFRPVDLQIGPDGALWVADFYNRIIGHYEVPLDHPGRDRERGRIWRIVPRGESSSGRNLPADPNAALRLPASAEELVAELASPNLARRSLALNELSARPGDAHLPLLQQAARGRWQFRGGGDRSGLVTSALWLLYRCDRLDDATLGAAAADHDATVRMHAMKILAEQPRWSGPHRERVLAALGDADAFVQRAAAEALGLHPAAAFVDPLLALHRRVPATDTHLLHATRIALRNCLAAAGKFPPVERLDEAASRALADLALAVTNAAAGSFLLGHLQRFAEGPERATRFLQQAARFGSADDLEALAGFARARFPADLDLQTALFQAVQRGAARRGLEPGGACHAWGADLAAQLLAAAGAGRAAWEILALDGAPEADGPWAFQERACADGRRAQLMSSHPRGETLTGVLRSASFPLPRRLSFYLAGHDGVPGQPAHRKNVVRLRDARTRAVLREAFPPRHDTARRIEWDLADLAGALAFIEVTDGDAGRAYAWLAVGRFDPPLPELELSDPAARAKRLQAGAELARTLRLAGLEPQLVRLLAAPATPPAALAGIASALVSFHPDAHLAALAPLLGATRLPDPLRSRIAGAFLRSEPSAAKSALVEAMRTAARSGQLTLAQTLAGTASGAESLLEGVRDGWAPAALLLDATVREKLLAVSPANAARIEGLTRNLPPASDARRALLKERIAGYAQARVSVAEGGKIFRAACAACHQLAGEGGLVGPQLDGIGNRGLERLVEDVLDPDANVDHAFRVTLFALDDGETITGLFRREEGAQLIYADAAGRETPLDRRRIKEQRETARSLMPDNFGEALTPEQFNDLMAFLLSQGAGSSSGR
jgi:putative heme-binding domain-containing protein